MAGDINDQDNLWRWLSHSVHSVLLSGDLHGLKDLLVPSNCELPPNESLEKVEDVASLEKSLTSKLQITKFEKIFLAKLGSLVNFERKSIREI